MKPPVSKMACFAAAISGCAELGADYDPILDGPPRAIYQSDLTDCQTLAASQDRFAEEAAGAALAGGLLGAAVADHDGSATLVEGLLGGALIAFLSAAFEASDEKRDIIVTCMQGRGHRVVG